MDYHLRIARPVDNPQASATLYCQALGLVVVGSFEDHDGYDGVMVGRPGMQYHFEFTACRQHPVRPSPTEEDLVVFYIPKTGEWNAACARMAVAGFTRVSSLNPYWDVRGRTFADPDGYRVVLENGEWTNRERD